jgi:hypothetical protein
VPPGAGAGGGPCISITNIISYAPSPVLGIFALAINHLIEPHVSLTSHSILFTHFTLYSSPFLFAIDSSLL